MDKFQKEYKRIIPFIQMILNIYSQKKKFLIEIKQEKEKNMIPMVNYHLRENIYIIQGKKVKNIIKENQNMKENIYMIENGMEKDMMKMVI